MAKHSASIRASMIGLAMVMATASLGEALADQPAKQAFGAATLPNAGPASPIGSYARGCMSGAVALPTDGPTWQAMRLSRNRRWGNPRTIAFIEQLSKDATKIGWPGLLVGDIAQPRGGPMASGHASHQIGMDFDVWLTPMPAKRLTVQQREDLPFTSMIMKDQFLTINPQTWSPARAKLLMLAASYPQVQRIFVNPAIKKKMCDTWTGDRTNMGKLRPMYGHDAHFHVRLFCPPGATDCKPQASIGQGDGCDKSLAWWFTKEPWEPKKKDPNAKPAPKPRPVMVSDLPKACSAILNAPAVSSEKQATYGGPTAYTNPGAVSVKAAANAPDDPNLPSEDVGLPKP